MRSTKQYSDPQQAMERVCEIYENQTALLREAFKRFIKGEDLPKRVRAYYPFVRIKTTARTSVDARHSFGFVTGPGSYQTTLTRPLLYKEYLLNQFRSLVAHHGVSLSVGVSEVPIPVHFAFPEGLDVAQECVEPERLDHLADIFDVPDLTTIDDRIVNGTYQKQAGEMDPLAFFSALRIDYSLHRLKHYTATSPEFFQSYILFTNYSFYVDEFLRIGREIMQVTPNPDLRAYRQQYTAFVEPGNVITWNSNLPDSLIERVQSGVTPIRQPQMPAYHLLRADGSGITLINIGVGPSNAKTITDHVAVLRPHVWLMLGHCAGLSTVQRIGDYVLAHAYVREDHVLDEEVPLWVPIPTLAEVQLALQDAVTNCTQLDGYELKRIMRTGTVASVNDRNWELRDHRIPMLHLNQSRAIALDMESATVASNGFRYRVPYGTLLCVSDKPLHGEIKLIGITSLFYEKSVNQHLKIGIKALELMRERGGEQLHSRKLRSFWDPAFR